MSSTAKREPTNGTYRLSLGRGDRFITDQGDGVETVDRYIAARPGARRSIEFHSCKLSGDIEIDGRKVDETSVRANVQERSPDQPPWPDEPWKIGALSWRYASLNLSISPVAFQQLWEIADAPDDEQFGVGISGQVEQGGVFIYEIRLERIRPRPHPLVLEIRRLGQIIERWAPALWWFVGVILAIELVRWLWR